MNKHWSDEDLIDRLYGIGPADGHLQECGDCRQRWLAVQRRREASRVSAEVPVALLAAQRARILERMEGGLSRPWGIRLTPALATLGVLVLGLVLSRPDPAPAPSLASNDSQFFTEIYAMVDSTGPMAADPIYGLFEEQQ